MKTFAHALAYGGLVAACADRPVTQYELPAYAAAPTTSAIQPPASPSASASAAPPPVTPPPPTPAIPSATPSTPAPSATTPPVTPPITPPVTPPVTPPPSVPLYAHVNLETADYLLSRTMGEGAPFYTYTRVMYRVLDAPFTGSIALNRCVDLNVFHYQSIDPNCEGVGFVEGALGYVYATNPGNGAKVIKRCVGPFGAPIITTIDPVNDCPGLVVQPGELGYAFAP